MVSGAAGKPGIPFWFSAIASVVRRLHVRSHLTRLALSCLVLSLCMGSMPIERHEATADSEPPVLLQEYQVEVPCQIGVFVDETNPTTNYNTAMQGGYLRVGTGPEFCGKLWTLLDIGPIEQSNGGPVPDGASITNARIKIRKESGPSDSIKVYGLQQGFNESSVTWNTKPARYESSQTAATAVPASNGWTYLNIPTYTLNDAINGNHGVRVALCPTWTACSRSVAFYSDDHSYRPSLVITYLGTAPEPTPPTPPVVNDTTPCQLQVTWTPSNPSPGQMVTVNAVAVDNVQMDYVAIYRGSQELARRDAASGQTSLSLSYSAAAQLPSMNFIVAARDASPYTTQVVRTVSIPVRGTNTPPEVSVEIDWEIDEVIPERYRLIKGDGQVATITVTASDPEGIDYMDIQCTGYGALQFDGHGQQSVTQTFDWVNNDPSATTFSCRLSAVDLEGNYASTEPEYIDIVRPGSLRLMATAAPGFHNPSRDRLPWERMVQTFGVGECYWLYPEWKSPYALIWYHAGFKNIGDGGECFGMSTMAAEIYQDRVTGHGIQATASAASYMDYDSSFTKEFVEARQGGQLGSEVAFKRYNQRYQSTSEKLRDIKSDLVADRPGVLSISEGDGGHAIVPWMTRRMGDGTTRVYVYDCNREGGIISTRDGGNDNPAFDFNNVNHYPYVEFDGSSWGYLWGDGTTWNDELAYFTYEEACGDMDQENPLGGPFDPHLTDHDIPSIFQYMFAPIGGDVDVVIEDEAGNRTGIHEGELVEEIPESMALVPMMRGPFTEHELYVLPMDKQLKFRVSGNSDGEYVLGLLGDGLLIALDQMDASEGSEDLLTLEPWADALGRNKVRVRTAQATDGFQLILAVMFEGVVMATDSDFIGREYIMDFAASLAGLDFSVYVEEGGDTLAVENHGEEDVVFDATFRTTESLDEVGTELSELPFIPSSGAEDVTVRSDEEVELTPERWQTTDERAGLHVLRDGKESSPQGSSFPVLPVAIGGAVLALVVCVVVLLKKGIIRVGKSS